MTEKFSISHLPILWLTKTKKELGRLKRISWSFQNAQKKIQLDEGCVIYIDKEDKDGVKVIKFESPHIQVKKVGEDKGYVMVDVHTVPHVEVQPKVQVLVDTKKYEKLIEKIKEKLKKLKVEELDSKAKEVELEGIEEILEALQKALEKKHEKSTLVDVHVSPKVSHAYKIRTKDIHLDHAKEYSTVGITDDKGMFTLIYKADIESDQKEAYKRAINKLESKLPEDYSLNSTFDDDEGTLVIKIKKEKKEGEEYKEAVVSLDEIKELIEEFKKDLEKIKK